MKFTNFDQTPVDNRDPMQQWFAATAPSSLADDGYFQLLYLLATGIVEATGDEPVVVSVAGAQGSGKSTLAELLSDALRSVLNVPVADLSLDDFYLTRAERETLASTVHPMLGTRGVPGTHDVELMNEVLATLREGQSVEVPVFDKSEDDRSPKVRQLQSAPVIVCEGWCWGATPQAENQLDENVNTLEATEDQDGRWRRYVNESLKAYQPVFESDAFVFLQVPDMEAVYRWRWQQEQAANSGGSATMDEQGVRQFIAYYERITRWMLLDCPDRADVTVRLDDEHRVRDAVIARNA